jgi:hypothetical protein
VIPFMMISLDEMGYSDEKKLIDAMGRQIKEDLEREKQRWRKAHYELRWWLSSNGRIPGCDPGDELVS